ncbi:MAG: ligase-associated DNA damage response endonuclease PdeM [Chitinophagaceae bacterium]|nr:ligase-associated DNA damage response endonuclease PdeM [Chitinophagaceae bacterium]
MAAYISYLLQDQHLVMSAERTLFWENESTLIVADIHAGKTGHFRKAGIGIPQNVYKDDLHRLLTQVLFFKAEKLIIVGDLSHSLVNKELDLFRKWRHDFPSLEVILVKGNHDILGDRWYAESAITVSEQQLLVKNFLFVHDILTSGLQPAPGKFVFSGHLHPGITIRGRGRQTLRFPCFYYTPQYCVLPAFSRFTGTFKIEPDKGEKVFAIIDKEIVSL